MATGYAYLEPQRRRASRKVTAGSSHTKTTYKTEKTQETLVNELTDDGTGGLGDFGTVNYGTGALNVRLVELDLTTEGYKSDHEDAESFESYLEPSTGGDSAQKGGEYGDTSVGEELLAASTLTVTYATDFASTVTTEYSFKPPTITIDLCPYTSDYVDDRARLKPRLLVFL